MRERDQNRHMIDLLFPVALLFLFAVSAVVVLLLATRIYRETVEASATDDTARISLAYITESIHQNDQDGAVSVTELDGCAALLLRRGSDDFGYCTYIYAQDGVLRELFIPLDVEPSASAGRALLQGVDLCIEPLEDALFRFSCTDDEGHTASTVVAVRSQGGAA